MLFRSRARISASLEKKRLRDQERALLDQLQIERAKAERLLQNVLPKAIAERLKAGQRTIVDSFIDATVLFADIVGFTRIASKQSPHRTVQLLNEIFSGFDRIVEQFELEKIKTIGDAYMTAAGLPLPAADHAVRSVRAALALTQFIETRNVTSAMKWGLRVGIHSGAVVAGIVGKHKYAYDVWGDTVNIASRLESASEPGRVNISAYTYELVRKHFVCEYRGKLAAKGKGAIDMYFAVREINGSEPPPAR